MTGRKHSQEPASASSSKKAKRQVTKATFSKWQREHDREHQTLSWLRCRMDVAKEGGVAKARGESAVLSSPIGCALSTLNSTTRARMGRIFDLCFMMAKERIAFAKYLSLLELEKHHGVDLGHAYMSDHILQMSGQTHIWPDICQTPQNNYNWLCRKTEKEQTMLHAAAL